tara:strand:- start:720 stop:1529 length:810 start_codon:yes stop_codon:yes gene_type:complete
MPSSSSSDIPHVTITDHKIAVPNLIDYTNKNMDREFVGLFSINNDSPTNLSKAKAYLKRYESFEKNPLYLDSALAFLENSDQIASYPYYVQLYYLKEDYFSLINYYLANQEIDLNVFSNDVISLAVSRIGEAYSKNGLLNEAISLFEKSIDLSPFIIDYKLKLIALYIDFQAFAKAENLLENLKKLNPERKEVYLNISYLNILQEEYSLAENNLLIAINLDPDYILAYENLILLNIKKNNLFLAKKYLNQLLSIDSDNIKAKKLLKSLN